MIFKGYFQSKPLCDSVPHNSAFTICLSLFIYLIAAFPPKIMRTGRDTESSWYTIKKAFRTEFKGWLKDVCQAYLPQHSTSSVHNWNLSPQKGNSKIPKFIFIPQCNWVQSCGTRSSETETDASNHELPALRISISTKLDGNKPLAKTRRKILKWPLGRKTPQNPKPPFEACYGVWIIFF